MTGRHFRQIVCTRRGGSWNNSRQNVFQVQTTKNTTQSIVFTKRMEISNCSQHMSQHVARSPPETIQALLLWGILSRFNCNRTSYIFTEMHLAEFLSIFKTLLRLQNLTSLLLPLFSRLLTPSKGSREGGQRHNYFGTSIYSTNNKKMLYFHSLTFSRQCLKKGNQRTKNCKCGYFPHERLYSTGNQDTGFSLKAISKY